MRSHLATYLITILLSAAALAPTAAVAQGGPGGDRPLVFGVLPIVSTERLAVIFEPIVDYVARDLGVQIHMESAPDYAEFIRRTHEDRRYDFLFTAPHFYYLAQRRAGYRVVARVDGAPLSAVIVTRTDSEITSLDELRGRKVATPDPLALATVLVQVRLSMAGIDPESELELVATPSHNASLLSVVKGFTDAAGVGTLPLARAAPEIRDQVRIIAETHSGPHMPFSVAPWVETERAEAFARALVAMKSDPQGRAALKGMNWPGFVRTIPAEYDVLRPYAERMPAN